MVGINLYHVYNLFKDYLAYDEDSYKLLKATEDKQRSLNKKMLKDLMRFLRDNHTYINRIENILKLLKVE
jgi:hypothetical protein